MKKKKVIWEQYALYATLFLMIALGAVFAPRREAAKEVDIAQSDENLSETDASLERNDKTQIHWVVTSCGEKERPDPMLLWPNPMLKSHIADYEKETSSFLERTKLKNGVSMVFIREFCPDASTHYSFHFPEKRLVASAPNEATQQYQLWVANVIDELRRGGAIHAPAQPVLEEIERALRAGTGIAITPYQPEWGGVQITFRK